MIYITKKKIRLFIENVHIGKNKNIGINLLAIYLMNEKKLLTK